MVPHAHAANPPAGTMWASAEAPDLPTRKRVHNYYAVPPSSVPFLFCDEPPSGVEHTSFPHCSRLLAQLTIAIVLPVIDTQLEGYYVLVPS